MVKSEIRIWRTSHGDYPTKFRMLTLISGIFSLSLANQRLVILESLSTCNRLQKENDWSGSYCGVLYA